MYTKAFERREQVIEAVAGSRRDVQTFSLNPGKNQRKCTSGLRMRDIVRDTRRMSFSSDYANYMDIFYHVDASGMLVGIHID